MFHSMAHFAQAPLPMGSALIANTQAIDDVSDIQVAIEDAHPERGVVGLILENFHTVDDIDDDDPTPQEDPDPPSPSPSPIKSPDMNAAAALQGGPFALSDAVPVQEASTTFLSALAPQHSAASTDPAAPTHTAATSTPATAGSFSQAAPVQAEPPPATSDSASASAPAAPLLAELAQPSPPQAEAAAAAAADSTDDTAVSGGAGDGSADATSGDVESSLPAASASTESDDDHTAGSGVDAGPGNADPGRDVGPPRVSDRANTELAAAEPEHSLIVDHPAANPGPDSSLEASGTNADLAAASEASKC